MAGKLIHFMHLSVDGFVSSPEGGLQWTNFSDARVFDLAGEICGAADLVVYGRGTYDIMEAYWPSASERPGATDFEIRHAAWYRQIEKLVISRTIQGDPSRNMSVISDQLSEQFTALKSQADRTLLLMGSPAAGTALAKLDLIDEYWLIIHPVILGAGKKMFHEPPVHELLLTEHRLFTSGVIALHYRVDKKQ